MHTLINNCRYIDAASSQIVEGSIGVNDGAIAHIGKKESLPDNNAADNTIDAKGKLVIPGLIDCYARLREPGFEKLATIASESNAALHNGCLLYTSPSPRDS